GCYGWGVLGCRDGESRAKVSSLRGLSRPRSVAVIGSALVLGAAVLGAAILPRDPATAAVCGDSNPPPPDTGAGGPSTCQSNPSGTDGYYVLNTAGNVYGLGNASAFSGFGTLHHASDGSDQDPGGVGGSISTTGDGLGFYILDTAGNVYGRGNAAGFQGFGTLSQKESTSSGNAAGISVTHETGGSTRGKLI